MKTTTKVIKKAKFILNNAKLGLDDFLKDDDSRKLPGLTNLIVFGRAVTNVLQNLRSIESSFDEWYAKYVEEMEKDPLMRFFYEMRSEILKEGIIRPIGNRLHIKHFTSEMFNKFPKPEGANAFFMGDEWGRSGWIVQLPDGTEEKYFINIPADIAQGSASFKDSPTHHKGKPINDNSVNNLAKLYYEYISNMVEESEKQFNSESI